MAVEVKNASWNLAGEVVSFLQEAEVHEMRPRTPVADRLKDSFVLGYLKRAHLPEDVD